MGTKQPLPFAQLVPHLQHCAQCGYSLEGIAAPGVCPECGLSFEEGLSVLVLAGVARTASGPAWRKASWVGLGVLAFVTIQGAGLLFFFAPWIGLLLFVALVIGVVAMILTTRQKKGGTEYFVFTHQGLSRWTLGSDPTTRAFVAWSGDQRRATIKRVSSVWASIRIVCRQEDGRPRPVLIGGFRCREEDIELIEGVLNAMLLGEPIGDVEGLSASSWYESQVDQLHGREEDSGRNQP